jgi:hypothetical protein
MSRQIITLAPHGQLDLVSSTVKSNGTLELESASPDSHAGVRIAYGRARVAAPDHVAAHRVRVALT